jgi:hypothetical protein
MGWLLAGPCFAGKHRVALRGGQPTFNLYEILPNAQGGQALDNPPIQFGMPAGEADAAVKAVLPALSAGSRRKCPSADRLRPAQKRVNDRRPGKRAAIVVVIVAIPLRSSPDRDIIAV